MRGNHRACFICGTPFHVITSIILRHQLDIKSDIIIYDAFSNTDKLKINLENEKIFESVRVISRERDFGYPRSMILKYFYALFGYFRIPALVEKVFPDLSKYTEVFFANAPITDVIDRFIYCYLEKKYPHIKLYYMDEGMQCYDEKFYDISRLDYFFRKYVVRSKTQIFDEGIFSYNVDLYKWINPSTKRNIIQINKPDKKVIDIMKEVFSYITIQDISTYDVVILDTVRKEVFLKEGSIKFNQIVSQIVGDKQAIVKSHPRETIKFFDYDYFITNGFPFEILCLYNDLSDKTLISNDSSAVFTPKLIFDQEPQLVFTYRVLSSYLYNYKYDENLIVDRFKKLYRDDAQIVVLEDK